MNFNGLKKLVILAIVPLVLASGNHVAFAGGAFSSMKNKQRATTHHITCSSRKLYASHDMSRINFETFNYDEFNKKCEHDQNLYGPWRIMAYEKIKHNSKFAGLMPEVTQDLIDVVNMFRQLATIKCVDYPFGDEEITATDDYPPIPEKEFIPASADDVAFQHGFSKPTDSSKFEKVVEDCRREWNLAHDYKEPIRSSKEALEKTLRILKPAYGDADPFCNERVRVSYDTINKIYRIIADVKRDKDVIYSGYENMCQSVVLAASGEVISIDCKDYYLRKLV